MARAYHGPRPDNGGSGAARSIYRPTLEGLRLIPRARFGIPGLKPEAPNNIEHQGGKGNKPGKRIFHIAMVSRNSDVNSGRRAINDPGQPTTGFLWELPRHLIGHGRTGSESWVGLIRRHAATFFWKPERCGRRDERTSLFGKHLLCVVPPSLHCVGIVVELLELAAAGPAGLRRRVVASASGCPDHRKFVSSRPVHFFCHKEPLPCAHTWYKLSAAGWGLRYHDNLTVGLSMGFFTRS